MKEYRFAIAQKVAKHLSVGETVTWFRRPIRLDGRVFTMLRVGKIRIAQLGLIAVIDAREEPEFVSPLGVSSERPVVVVTPTEIVTFEEIDDGVLADKSVPMDVIRAELDYVSDAEYSIITRQSEYSETLVLKLYRDGSRVEKFNGDETNVTFFNDSVSVNDQIELRLSAMPRMLLSGAEATILSYIYGADVPLSLITIGAEDVFQASLLFSRAFRGERFIGLNLRDLPMFPNIILMPNFVLYSDPLFFTHVGVGEGLPNKIRYKCAPVNFFTASFTRQYFVNLYTRPRGVDGYCIFPSNEEKVVCFKGRDGGLEYKVIEIDYSNNYVVEVW